MRRKLCCAAAAALCIAAIVLTVATTRMAHSPWCDGPTLLPPVLCSLHPTRWVSKGSYKGFFKPRKDRTSKAAAAPASGASDLSADLDAASDSSEAGDGSLNQQRPAEAQPRQPANAAETPAAAKLDRLVDQIEAGGSPETAGSGPSGAPGEQQRQQQQQLGEPASEQPHTTEEGPAEQQRAEMLPGPQPAADQGGKPQQGAAAEQAPNDQPQQASGAQQTAPADAAAGQRQPQQQQAASDHAAKQDQTQQQQQTASVETLGAGRLPPISETIGAQQVIWEKPRGPPQGLFLALNGCNHGPEGWWDPQPPCPRCLGLPEEKAIVRTAVERGYIAIALGVVQQRKRMRCWANLRLPNVNTDMNATVASMRLLTEREGWAGLPLFAWGGSAGGTFAARLPYFLPLKGIMVQLKSVAANEIREDPTDAVTGETLPYPKVVYAYNHRDPKAQRRAIAFTDALKDKGVDFLLLAADPQPLRPSFFLDRIEGVSAEVSQQLFDALKGGGFLDDHNYLIENPRKSDRRWRPLLQDKVPYAKTAELRRYISPIFEELNWAYSNHQGISDCTAAAFEFFESGTRPDERMLENVEWWQLQQQQEQQQPQQQQQPKQEQQQQTK